MNGREGLSPEVASMIDEAPDAILQALSTHPCLVLLHGSQARGEANPEPGIDLLVVLEEDDPQTVAQVRDAVYEVMWNHDFSRLISVCTVSRPDFEYEREKGYSFVSNVERDGVLLWPAA